jgi:hypothetical protein
VKLFLQILHAIGTEHSSISRDIPLCSVPIEEIFFRIKNATSEIVWPHCGTNQNNILTLSSQSKLLRNCNSPVKQKVFR